MSGWNGIFYNGYFSLGFDFLATGTPTVGGVFDGVTGSPSIGSTYARYAGQGMQCNGNRVYITKSLHVNLQSMIIGFAFYCSALPSGSTLNMIATWYDATASGSQVTLCYNSQGQLGFYTGTSNLNSYGTSLTLVGALSAGGTIVAGSYSYIEALVTVSTSVGVVTAYVNGTQVINNTGLDTQTTTNAWTNAIYLGSSNTTGGGTNQYFDDLYMLDMTGSSPFNTFLGPGRIQTDGPSADSATSGLNAWSYTTPPGNDYGCCANIPPNSTEYCYDANVGDRMSFRFPSLSSSKVIALNTWFNVELDAAGTRTIVPIFRNNSVDQVGPSPISLASGYTYYNQPSTIDPNTGSPWASGTVAAAGGCEIGLKVNS